MLRKFNFIVFSVLCIALITLVGFEIFAVTQMSLQGGVALSYKPLKVGDIVSYGEYPQTYVGNTLNADLLSRKNAGTLTETGKTFSTYVCRTLTQCKEYAYAGTKYVLVEKAYFWNNEGEGSYSLESTFSTGDAFSSNTDQNKSYFFKVEPIKFRVMATNIANGKITVQCANILSSMPFSSSTATWADSDVRSWLNGAFLTESKLTGKAVATSNKNNVAGNWQDGAAANTTDTIWISSLDDQRAWYPSPAISVNSTNVHAFQKSATDFAIATYLRLLSSTDGARPRTSHIIYRSAGKAKASTDAAPWICFWQCLSGRIYNSWSVLGPDPGIVPCAVIDLNSV